MQRMSREKNILIFLIRVLPIVSIVIPIIGLILLVVILHRSDYLIKGLDLVVPIALGSIIILLYRHKLLSIDNSIFDNIYLIKYNKYIYYLIFLLIYLISVLICLLSTSMPLIYFFVVAIMAILIFVEIIFTQSGEKNILSKIILLLANLIYSQTLRLPLYFGGTDLLDHISYINSIVEFHHVTSLMGTYQYFPLYHILFACGQIVTNMYLRNNLFVFAGLIFLSTIYFIYLISYRITLNTRQSLLATFIYGVSYETVNAGMYMVTRDMAFALFLVLLYLLIAKKTNIFGFMAIGLILPFVYLHQVSLVQYIIIIYALIAIEWLIYFKVKTISYLFPILFVVCFLSYWVYTAGPFFDSILRIMKSTTDVVNVPTVESVAAYKNFIFNLDSSILAFFIIVGIIALLIKAYKNDKNVLIVQCTLISFLSLPLILPGPAAFLTSLLLSYRFPLVLSPFTIIAVSEGIIVLLLFKYHNIFLNMMKYSIIIIVIFIYVLATGLKNANANDLYLSNIFPPTDRTYFLSSEIAGLDFCVNNLKNKIFTDYESGRYLTSKNYKNVFSNIVSYDNLDNSKEDYFFFRNNHLNERGQLMYIAGNAGFMGIDQIYTNNDLEKINLYEKLNNNNLIYTNDSVELFDIEKDRFENS